jgi:hypothetical protein
MMGRLAFPPSDFSWKKMLKALDVFRLAASLKRQV